MPVLSRRNFLAMLATGAVAIGLQPAAAVAELASFDPSSLPSGPDEHIRDYLMRMRDFNNHHPGDICLDRAQTAVMRSSLRRLLRVQRTVGHGNFHMTSFDDALSIARNYSAVGPFTAEEVAFLESVFYEDAGRYGFYGRKPLARLTDAIPGKNVVWLRSAGNFLYKGTALKTYQSIRRDLGDKVVLTSGVRSIIKQFTLFLNKACDNNGNLSLASRQLAPPGYSYHGIGDFDVGQAGFGACNFTERFVTTDVYRQLQHHGYLTLRYPLDNLLGVRFEPWHIQVTMQA